MDPQLQERLPVASVLSGFPYAAACLSTIWYCGTKCLSNICHPTEWMCLEKHSNVDLFQIVDGDRREVAISMSAFVTWLSLLLITDFKLHFKC